MSEVFKPHLNCRVCGSKLNDPYLDLGHQPLANALRHPNDPGAEMLVPLAVALCPICGLSQLTVVVEPEVLYAGYRFRSGASAEWRAHCEALADAAYKTFKKPGLVLDIAANDGTQLVPFAERGWHTVAVEPADIPPVRHIGRIERAFWSMDVARMLRREHNAFDLVIAQNVLGHVDRPVEFLQAVEHVLAPDGMAVIEVPNVRNVLLDVSFDTVYHEHVSYWNAKALLWAARKANLGLFRIEYLEGIHGGSRRYWLTRSGGRTAEDHPAFELPIDDRPYRRYAQAVERRLDSIRRELEQLQAKGKRVWGYGASAKGAVMLNALKSRGNVAWPEVILDDVKEKQGFLSPGTRIPIRSINGEWPDVLWILSWNWADQLKARARAAGFTGEFFLTTPTVRRER